MRGLFEAIFADSTRKHRAIGVHAMGAYLDEYGRGGIRRKELIDELGLEGTARKEMLRLIGSVDRATDKTAQAMKIEMACMIEEVRGPDRARFYDRLFGRKRTINGSARIQRLGAGLPEGR